MISSSIRDPFESDNLWERRLAWAGIIILRVLSVVFFALTLLIWLRVVGYWEGTGFRFDTMTMSQKIYTVLLSVLFPVSSVGLWTTLSWGRVVWLLAIGVQLLAVVGVFADAGVEIRMMYFHAFSISIYFTTIYLAYLITKKQ